VFQYILAAGQFESAQIIALITVPCTVLAIMWAFGGSFRIESMRDLFVCVLCYYGLCVPLDMTLGFEMRGSRGDLPDINDPIFHRHILTLLIFHIVCLLAFLCAYKMVNFKQHRQFEIKQLKIYTPSLISLCVINVAYILTYIAVTGYVSRLDRLLLARESTSFKLFSVTITVILALDMIYMLSCNNRRHGVFVVCLSAILSLVTGARIWLLLFCVFYIARYRIRLSPLTLATLAAIGFLYGTYWKGFSHEYWENDRICLDTEIIGPQYVGLSSFEGVGPYAIATEILDRGDCPYWLGWSYYAIPAKLCWPRFLTQHAQPTLSEQFAVDTRGAYFDKGGGIGFSAIAESWLNFGIFGPLLLGIAWGIGAKFFDSRERGIGFIIFFIMTIRLMRSDFGSLFKSWIFLLGGSLIFVMCILSLYRHWLHRHRRPALLTTSMTSYARTGHKAHTSN
jgi:O-antigen polysaccharide polymerase Wzy-like protein